MSENITGRGWKFPISVDSSTGRIKTVLGEEDIKESIKLILMTSYKERIMKSEFGSSMRDYLFAESNQNTYTRIEEDAKLSIESWEQRVENVNVSAYPNEDNPNTIYIDISYTVKSTDNKVNQTLSFKI